MVVYQFFLDLYPKGPRKKKLKKEEKVGLTSHCTKGGSYPRYKLLFDF